MVTVSMVSPLPARPPRPPWYSRIQYYRFQHSLIWRVQVDVAVAVGSFAAFTLPTVLGGPRGQGSTRAVVMFGALAVAPLLVRRRWPLAALAGVAAVDCLAALFGVRFTPFVSNAGPAVAVAVATVADRLPRRISLAATAAAVVATGAAGLIALNLHPDHDQNFVQLIVAAPAWLLGDTVRTRRGYRQRLALELDRRSAEREHRIRAEERLRVSRDVHDVVSHTLSMIAVRSGVARLLLHEQPGEAKDALAVIETASRSALDELRHVLMRIRDATPPHQSEPTAELGRARQLSDLGELVDALRHEGFALSLRSTGGARSYPAVLETSAYRVAQEALTNVAKHAATATQAWVEIHHGNQELVISVVDNGTDNDTDKGTDKGTEHQNPGARSGQGIGLVGMRERAELFGGSVTAGPRPGGGFAVVARFPTGCFLDAR